LQLKKCIFFTALFWLLLWLCKAWEGAPMTF
jgi:hypothetical protein